MLLIKLLLVIAIGLPSLTSAAVKRGCSTPHEVSEQIARSMRTPLAGPALARVRATAADVPRVVASGSLFRHPNQKQIRQVTGLINPAHDAARGKYNLGVFRVELTDGSEGALKLAKGVTFDLPSGKTFSGRIHGNDELFSEYVAIHDLLGKKGHAPQLLGISTLDELPEVIGNHNLIEMGAQGGHDVMAAYQKPTIGLLMEYIPDRWALSRDVPIPDFVKDLTDKQMVQAVKRMKDLERTLLDNNINPNDLQILLTRDGRPLVIDMDGFRFLRDGESNGTIASSIQEQTQRMISGWEIANQTRFSGHSGVFRRSHH